MKKTLEKFGLVLGLGLAVANSLSAQDCDLTPHFITDYVVSGNFTKNAPDDYLINDVIMLSRQDEKFRIDALISQDNGKRVLKKGTSLINYDLDNVNGRMVRGDFDNDGHIDDFILINKTGISSMRFDLFSSNGVQPPAFLQNSVYTLNGYDPDKITGRVVSGDFDNDGYWDDIAAFYDYGNGETRIHTFRSNGSTFVYSSSVGWWNSTGYTASRVTNRVVSGDFDRDGTVDDIAAFYDYGNGETRIHVWLSTGSNFWYQSSVGWWGATGYYSSKISKRVVSLNIDRDGKNYDDIAVFYAYSPSDIRIHVFKSNGSSFDYSGPSGWWSSAIPVAGIAPLFASAMNGKIVEFDSRSLGINQGKPSDIIAFNVNLLNLQINKYDSYQLWESKGYKVKYSKPKYCESKSNFEEDPNSKEEVTVRRESTVKENVINAYPNPTKSATTIEIPKSLLDNTSVIEVRDFYGKLVFSKKVTSSKINIDLSKNNSGIYLVKVIGNTSTRFVKIVKE